MGMSINQIDEFRDHDVTRFRLTILILCKDQGKLNLAWGSDVLFSNGLDLVRECNVLREVFFAEAR